MPDPSRPPVESVVFDLKPIADCPGQLRLFSQIRDDAHVLLQGLQGACGKVYTAVSRTADRRTHTAWCSLSSLAKMAGIHRGTASRARRALAEVGLIEAVMESRRGAWMVRLCFRSAAPAHPIQSRSAALNTRGKAGRFLRGLIALRCSEVVRTHPPAEVEARKRRASWLHVMRGIPMNQALEEQLLEAASPTWPAMRAQLQRQGVSLMMADLLSRAFPDSRIQAVVFYCQDKGYSAGAIVRGLLERWAVS